MPINYNCPKGLQGVIPYLIEKHRSSNDRLIDFLALHDLMTLFLKLLNSISRREVADKNK